MLLYHSALEKSYIVPREDIYYNRAPQRRCKSKKKCYCSIENRCLYIECKERSTVCTIALIFVLPILTPSRNVNEFQNRVMKMLMNMHICTLINVSLLSLSIFKMVLMT